ncbi:MAG: DUF3109 family protein [Crocinitomicaceae bacterium]|nr:DUF3109 family protein [Crocinitomicaceae bacterium]MDG1658832.1 DUF3109 family protein [Crocinitomicaceae bacterium]MDG2440439.1 DUF3109 family protein [Crocinitomicaceae bacterium]
MVEVKDKVVSTQIFDRKFVCDLSACKGACCIEGDAGAPLTLEEVDILEDNLEVIKPYMRKEGIEAIDKTGVFYMDQDNEPVTTLVNDAECAFVFFDENGITKCSVEQAHLAGKLDFKKPLSCHLYPIRTKKFNDFTALNYDEWKICEPACDCGDKLDVPVYKFLKEPLVRAFGEEFFKELEVVASEIKNR